MRHHPRLNETLLLLFSFFSSFFSLFLFFVLRVRHRRYLRFQPDSIITRAVAFLANAFDSIARLELDSGQATRVIVLYTLLFHQLLTLSLSLSLILSRSRFLFSLVPFRCLPAPRAPFVTADSARRELPFAYVLTLCTFDCPPLVNGSQLKL